MKGRIFGLIIGALIAGPIGALIGFFFGYFVVDKTQNQRLTQAREAAGQYAGGQNEALIYGTFALMGYVSRGAGRINEQHISKAESIMNMLRLTQTARQVAIAGFNNGKSEAFDLQRQTAQLRAICGSNLTMTSYVLEFLVQMALSDGVLESEERFRLLECAQLMGISETAMQRLIDRRMAEMNFQQQYRQYSQGQGYQGGSGYGSSDSDGNYGGGYGGREQGASKSELKSAYQLLEVSEDASLEEVRHAYKKLMLKYHPDRLKSQGIPEEMAPVYQEKAQQIQAAFDLIKEHLS